MTDMTIYLDMDGVLCDFHTVYEKHYGKLAPEDLPQDIWEKNFEEFIRDRRFEELEFMPGAEKLLSYITNFTQCNVEILSSTGGIKYMNVVPFQKDRWLRAHGINYKANYVGGRKSKGKYASKWSILIDDHPECIDAFTKRGGTGILHTDVQNTIEKLQTEYMTFLLHERSPQYYEEVI